MKKKKPLEVIAGTSDRPLIIGDIEIPCYVLEDETRVLSQRGVYSGINVTRGGPRNETEAKLVGAEMPRFANQNWLKPFISNELEVVLKSPILFNLPSGVRAYGYPATVLANICDAILEAHKKGATTDRQSTIVQRAISLIRGFSIIGIIALVDEATGFQSQRDKDALKAILDAYFRKEFATWAKRFPDEFYIQIFRLKGWQWKGMKVNRPSVVGRYTNDIVYKRLAPNIVDELEKRNPKNPSGNRSVRHHQWLTKDVGNPALAQHLYAVIALMKAATNWDKFMTSLERAFPEQGNDWRFRLDGNNKNS